MQTKSHLLLLAATFIITAASAQSAKSELLTGSWKVKSLTPEFPAHVTKKEKAKDEKIIAGDQKDFKKTNFKFTKDGRLIVGEKEFTWKMDSDEEHVKVMKDGKEIIVAAIQQLSPHKLVFIRPDKGMQVTYTLTR
jgi:hypothetical protein